MLHMSLNPALRASSDGQPRAGGTETDFLSVPTKLQKSVGRALGHQFLYLHVLFLNGNWAKPETQQAETRILISSHFILSFRAPSGCFYVYSASHALGILIKCQGSLAVRALGIPDFVQELHQTGCYNGIRFKGVRTLLSYRSRSCTMRQTTATKRVTRPSPVP